MVREYPAVVITDERELSKNSENPAVAHPHLCLEYVVNEEGVFTDSEMFVSVELCPVPKSHIDT